MRIQRSKQKKTQYESKQKNKEYLQHVCRGEGLFVYRNRTNGDLKLPKPTLEGITTIRPNQEWQGDNYYMSLVPQEAILVRTITSPTQERNKIMQEQKLILDQPEKIMTQGQVEYVVETQPQKINETPINKHRSAKG